MRLHSFYVFPECWILLCSSGDGHGLSEAKYGSCLFESELSQLNVQAAVAVLLAESLLDDCWLA